MNCLRSLECWERWFESLIKEWMFMCVYSMFVLFCVYVATLRRADPQAKESYRLCIGLRNCKSGQDPAKDCKAIDRYVGL
jgi:hypothetical protein